MPTQGQVPVAYSLLCVRLDGFIERHSYLGLDCVDHFIKTAMDLANTKIDLIRKRNVFVPPDKKTLLKFQSATHCELCSAKFDSQ